MAKQGRPPKPYKPEYDELLIDHLSQGYSFESFGGVVMVGKTQLYEWVKNHESFSNAKNIGTSASLLWHEKTLNSMANTPMKDKNVTALVWGMKNRFGWRDKKETLNENTNIEIIVDQRPNE